MKENPEILNEYLNYLLSMSYSTNTVQTYNFDLLLFFNFIKQFLNIKADVKDFNKFILLQVKKKDVIAFIVYCNHNRENNPYTRQRKLVAIRGFYNWLLETFKNDFIENPANDLGTIQKIERIPKYLSLEEAKKIQTIFTPQNSYYSTRNNTIISLFLSTGLRVSELISIRFCDIDFNNRTIQIIGKGNMERTVYFSNACKEKLVKYINSRTDNSRYLFVSNKGTKLSRMDINYIIKRAYKLMNIEDKNYSTHTLRHTAATLLYMYVKEDTLLLKEFLGHKSIASTQVYTHIHNQQLKKAVESNPLSNFLVNKR